ncbi:MAG: Rrf2 family transcriptional regulator [Armatimonadota bacterium]|nr:Rrf2 family transcriptional regulator [Armatimonadota bacterium]MDR7486301.1 Rrf2 family transcriptional regulator [Armatimonadota bacterium]MDR7532276.1 Rrf2 family transcriptional regulator [Armatimonadota bacterium]MDR7537251.1 Rrf2 family transcriptional regulator [Armatimonadota bacterium]
MELSRATQFALRTVLDLAINGPGRTAEIARRRGIPPAAAAKVVQAMVRGGVVRTARGAGGGVRLARAPAAVSLRDVVESVEGPMAIARCLVWDDCPCVQPCPVRLALGRLQREVVALLERTTLADLAADARHLEEARGADAVDRRGNARALGSPAREDH